MKQKSKVKFLNAEELNKTPAPKSITTYEPSQSNYPVPMTQQYRIQELNRESNDSPSLAEHSNERTKILITQGSTDFDSIGNDQIFGTTSYSARRKQYKLNKINQSQIKQNQH